jgi:hypothetical protein
LTYVEALANQGTAETHCTRGARILTPDLIGMRSASLERLAGYGINVAQVLRYAGVPSSRFQSSKACLSTREFFALWRAVEEAGSPDLGLRLASEMQPHQLDVSSLAALHSPSLGEALTKLARYKRICFPEELRIDHVDGEARISLRWVHAEERLPMILVDATFAHVLALAHHAMGEPLTPVRL